MQRRALVLVVVQGDGHARWAELATHLVRVPPSAARSISLSSTPGTRSIRRQPHRHRGRLCTVAQHGPLDVQTGGVNVDCNRPGRWRRGTNEREAWGTTGGGEANVPGGSRAAADMAHISGASTPGIETASRSSELMPARSWRPGPCPARWRWWGISLPYIPCESAMQSRSRRGSRRSCWWPSTPASFAGGDLPRFEPARATAQYLSPKTACWSPARRWVAWELTATEAPLSRAAPPSGRQ